MKTKMKMKMKMKKTKLSLMFLLCFFVSTVSATIHTINSGGYYYNPSSLTVNVGDTVEWINDGGNHNVNADINAITGVSFNNPESFISPAINIPGAIIHTHIFTIPGLYNYDCSVGSHAANGMVGSITVSPIPVLDCNGVAGGTSLVDTCDACNQAYLYDYVVHTVTFIDDTVGVVPGPTEMLVMPDNPDNPYWNTSCVSNTIYDIVSNSEDHTTLKAAIDACALDAVLKGAGPFTLFAPTDAAFDALPPGTVSALLGDIPQLTDILKHHVVGDSVMSGMLSNNMVVTTLNGTDITVYLTGGMVYIDNALVTVADIIADNGVVHVIDAVLLPEINSVGELNVINDKIYMYSVNILGEKVNKDLKNQIVFDIFNTGAVIKRFIK